MAEHNLTAKLARAHRIAAGVDKDLHAVVVILGDQRFGTIDAHRCRRVGHRQPEMHHPQRQNLGLTAEVIAARNLELERCADLLQRLGPHAGALMAAQMSRQMVG